MVPPEPETASPGKSDRGCLLASDRRAALALAIVSRRVRDEFDGFLDCWSASEGVFCVDLVKVGAWEGDLAAFGDKGDPDCALGGDFTTLCLGVTRDAEVADADGESFRDIPAKEGRGFWGLLVKLLLPLAILDTFGLVFEAADEGLGSPLEGVEGCCSFDVGKPGPMLCLIVLGVPTGIAVTLLLVGVEKACPCKDILGPSERFLGAGGP
jgi:hypothetical protein